MVKITEHLVLRTILITSLTEVGLWLITLLCTMVSGALRRIDGFSSVIVLSLVFAFGASALGVMCSRYRRKEIRVFFFSGQLVMVCMHIWCIVMFSMLEWVSHSGGVHITNLRALDGAMTFIVFSLIASVFGAIAGVYYWKKDFESEAVVEQEDDEHQSLL